ncbi:hypothetical protein [Maribacter cobaltidurans]|uniref:Uncharacterized protein n=1 Tax=Maribacter cobaltidurans TaxID=1178778 RepID=A0A223V395_9FLAO|nr:hypothetical protein [Maribacter cobaltidurans]ASV29746.1 hypothetical protein CJ263_05660 [Maribacter cobaltidurans]GGD92931.1 hypothetical protein GCM10011412_33590 [Maribacter cobaltidurans]
MKKLKYILGGILCISTVFFYISCSKDGDENNTTESNSGKTFLKLKISGTVINGDFDIIEEEIPEDESIIIGHIYYEESTEGTQKVASLFFTQLFGMEGERNFEMVIPAEKGAKEIGTQFPNPAPANGEPIYYMEIDLKETDYALYDSDNDGDNDANNLLRAKTMGVTITEIGETYNALGILTLSHIKGSFQGTGFLTAYTGPTTAPQELEHTITGSFEYYIPNE